MGLASKLASAGPPPGAAPGGYPPQGQPAYGGQPGQQQYPPQGQQQKPGYGQAPPAGYPPQGQQQYGGAGAPPPQAGPAQIAGYKQALQTCIQEKQLQNFFPPNSPVLDQLANKAAAQVGGLCQRWRIPQEIGNDLCKLGLYDIVIYIDDSGSMQFEENGERIKDLKLILERVASVATIFDDDGISLRFMNARYEMSMLENIRSEQQIDQLMRSVQFKGLTPMGTELRSKVIDGLVIPKMRQGQYRKPTLVITITDGQPAGEAPNTIFETIKYAADQVGRQFGPGGISFQFAQVGNDLKAREFLGKLDEDPAVGRLVDCTSNYENESEEMQRQGVNLTPELWLVKLLLGSIDSSYDRKDEKAGGAGAPPPGQYGGAPGGGYGQAPPGQYGGAPGGGYGQQPPQGQYGAPPQGGQYGHPPQGGQQYGQPPPGQGYGRGGPPPGYPPQGGQGGYGAPAPPRY